MKLLYFLITTLLVLNSFGQKQERSQLFEEPHGWNKIVILKSNFTFHIELTSNDGVNTTLYNNDKKLVYKGTLELNNVKKRIGFTTIIGTYEISEDLVVFFQTISSGRPTLIRVIINGTTGLLKSEEKVTDLDPITIKNGYALAYGDVDYPVIKIEKDQESDYYAVIRYNTLASETKDRIQILHYNPQHKIINQINYTTPSDKYKYTKYLSAYVKKDEFIMIGTYAFNTKKSGGEEARFYVSKLLKGSSNLIQKELPYSDFYKGASCSFIYNKSKNMINMVLITDAEYVKNNLSYDIVYQNIDIETMTLKKSYKSDFTTINKIYNGKMERKNGFNGVIQGAYIDKVGNFIVLYQNTEKKYSFLVINKRIIM